MQRPERRGRQPRNISVEGQAAELRKRHHARPIELADLIAPHTRHEREMIIGAAPGGAEVRELADVAVRHLLRIRCGASGRAL